MSRPCSKQSNGIPARWSCLAAAMPEDPAPITHARGRDSSTGTGEVTARDVADAAYPDAAGRLSGFRSLAGDSAPVVQAHDLTVEAGEAAARLLLDVPTAHRPTAVVAQADLLAAGVVRAAEALGLRVPEDLSVTGFDGVDLPWLDHVLTTVEQPGAAKGRAMGRLVRLALEGRQIDDEPFPVRLRVGTTSSSPPSVTS